MYEAYWGLSESPFSNRLSTRWFHESPVHEEALARLFFVIEQRRQFGLLSGEPGTGKSLTLRAVCEQCRRSQCQIVSLNLLGIDAHELLWQLAIELRLSPSENESRWSLWRRITDRITSLELSRTQTVFVLDHLERADTTCHSLIERLLGVTGESNGLATYIASVRTRDLPRLSDFLGDISDLRVELMPLQLDETEAMVRDLLTRSGGDEGIFNHDALLRLQTHSRGCPRLISRLCELSLIAGMAGNNETIDGELVDSVATGLVTPTEIRGELRTPEYV
jgi:general secretion pathway protein A